MTTPAVTVAPEATVAEAARLLDRHHIKRLPVVDPAGRLVGLVSRRDLLRVFLRSDDSIRDEIVQDVFSRLLAVDPAAVAVYVEDGAVTLVGRLERKSAIPIAVRLAAAVEGVVTVGSRLDYAVDDTGQATRWPEG